MSSNDQKLANLITTFFTVGNPCVNFFLYVFRDTPSETLIERLKLAWSHDSLTTLKLVCNLREVRGTGKSDKEGFYSAALWLHENHPKTLAYNVPSLADFGCFKDLPEILYRLLNGSEVRKTQKEEWNERKSSSRSEIIYNVPEELKDTKSSSRLTPFVVIVYDKEKKKKKKKNNDVKDNKGWKGTKKDSELTEAVAARVKDEKKAVQDLHQEKRFALAKKFNDCYTTDPKFKCLYDSICTHFADCLKKDLQFLKSGSLTKISLAAKWCPSLGSSFDRSLLLCESIAKRIFPKEEYEGVEEAHYLYRVRDRLRKHVLVPLRKALELPEVFISANQWGSIPYNRVASVAMKFYKEKFLKHDKERFEKYLKDVKAGNTTAALLPREIIEYLEDGDSVEEQWKRTVDGLLKKGKMKNCLAVCGVSRSMHRTPVALGLLVSELSEEPWKGKVITFSMEPQLHVIQGGDLKSKTEFVRSKDEGINTEFQKVFDCILDAAVNGNLKEDQMIKKIVVFSDMEFVEASANYWDQTDYQAITRKYREKGFGSAVPRIVFWNLRNSRVTPVLAARKGGVTLVSGFSKNLLKLFLDNEGEISPEEAMEAAIAGPEYQKLVVLD
jgi:hypothetical protein